MNSPSLAAQIAPAALDVLDQRLRLVLREHGDLADAGIHAIGQHEIDDAEFAAERRRGFAAMQGERVQPLAATARHDNRQGAARQAADVASGIGPSSVSHTCPFSRHGLEAPLTATLSVPYSAIRRISIFRARLRYGPTEAMCSQFGDHAVCKDRRPRGRSRGTGPGTRASRPRCARIHAAVRIGPAYSSTDAAGPGFAGHGCDDRLPAVCLLGAHGELSGYEHRDVLHRMRGAVRPPVGLYARPRRAPALPAVHPRGDRELPAPRLRSGRVSLQRLAHRAAALVSEDRVRDCAAVCSFALGVDHS